MRVFNYKLAILLFTFIFFGASAANKSEFIWKKEFSILFVGNSLTYYNDLPKLVKKVAKRKGITIKTKIIAKPDYALIDHWNDGDVQKEISKNHYDFVILQQGPSSQSFGREILIEYGKKFHLLCANNHSKLCYFMVWPSLNNYHTFKDVIENHREASSLNDAILLPVGEVWKEHFDSTENFDYYGTDGFHPSKKGSVVAAETIVEYLFE